MKAADLTRKPYLALALVVVIALSSALLLVRLRNDGSDDGSDTGSDPLGDREGAVSQEGGAQGNAAEAFAGGQPALLYATYGATDSIQPPSSAGTSSNSKKTRWASSRL